MSENKPELRVGQSLFRKEADKPHAYEVKISKVGRLWVTVIDGNRERQLDPATMHERKPAGIGGHAVPAVYFRNQGEYAAHSAHSRRFHDAKRRFAGLRPEAVTPAQLDQILAALGWD